MESKASKVFVVDDLLPEAATALFRREIEALKGEFHYDATNPDYVKYRMHLDRVFEGRREQSAVLTTMEQLLFRSPLAERAQGELLDFCVRSIPLTNHHVTFVTAHMPSRQCGWHANDITLHMHQRVVFTLSFMYYLDCGGRFRGGELLISHDNIPPKEAMGWDPSRTPTVHEVIEPRHNRLVLLPTTYWHMVVPLEAPGWREPLDGRVSVNGHIGFKLG